MRRKLIIFGAVFLLFVSLVSADIFYSYEDPTPEGSSIIYDEVLEGWTIQANETTDIIAVEPYIVRTGTPNNCYMLVYDADSSTKLPTTLLENTTFNANAVSTSVEFFNITLDTAVSITSGDYYSFVIECQTAISNRLNWWQSEDSDPTPTDEGRVQYFGGWNLNTGLHGNLNIYEQAVTGDDCDYSGSGDWIIAEDCHIDTSSTLEVGKVLIVEEGYNVWIDEGVVVN